MLKNKKVKLVLLILLLVVAGFLVWFFLKPEANKSTGGNYSGGVNLQPATEEDKKRADDNKQKIANQEQSTQSQNSNGKKNVSPVITYAGQYGNQIEVGSYVSGVFEDGGICTATFSKGSTSFTRTTSGVSGSNNVNCPALVVDVDNFNPKGTWTVKISYDSSSSSGVSTASQLEIK